MIISHGLKMDAKKSFVKYNVNILKNKCI